MSPALREVALVFLRLGATAFGGPAAHVALMEDELVRRRGWVTQAEFLDLFGATNLIPGPNSTELAIHLGHRRAGWPGLVVAGACFILPAALVTLAFAWAYVRFGSLPAAQGLLSGVKPVVVAIVLQALWRLARTAVRSSMLAAVGLGALLLALFGVGEITVLLVAGALLAAIAVARRRLGGTALSIVPAVALPGIAVGTASAPITMPGVFLVFAKIGSVLFGSGYVLLAFLRAELVERRGWLTETQLLDAVAAGQITPGPVFSTATFVGYLLGGVSGAGAATLGIFLPAFVFVALSGPLVPRLRRSPVAAAFLDGVNVASLALMAVVTVELGRAALVDVRALLLCAVSGGLLVRFKVNPALLVLGGAVVGLLVGG